MFYTNPQFYFTFDRSKCVNPAIVDQIDTLITYKNDNGADVKLYLVRAESKDRVTTIKDD
jgi:hypothetical protein